eukprot:12902478-Prorocentrum_lima.AAC.1
MLARPGSRRRGGGPRPAPEVQVTEAELGAFWGKVWGLTRPEPELWLPARGGGDPEAWRQVLGEFLQSLRAEAAPG